jgi:F-box protein 11
VSNVSEPLATSSGCSTTTCHHHSPYDLRKKSPSTSNCSENWVGGCVAGAAASSSSSTSHAAGHHQQPYHHYPLNNSNTNYDYLPARKRPRRTYSSTDTSTTTAMSAAHYLQYEMPDEVLLTIFSYLLEQDLCRVALVCKRFNAIANDCGLWKRLYQNVYEYDLPLFMPEHGVMNFVKVEDCEFNNPWKESFRQLYHGIHVRVGYQEKKYQGRNISYFNTVQAALDYADERNAANTQSQNNQIVSANTSVTVGASSANISNPPASPSMVDETVQETQNSTLIFLHAGIYRGEFLVIDSDITLIGAAPGNVAESVVLERESESTVMFVEGAKNAYIGHMTLKFSPDITSTVPHHKHYCLEIGENCSPTIDHCIIRSTSVGEFLI